MEWPSSSSTTKLWIPPFIPKPSTKVTPYTFYSSEKGIRQGSHFKSLSHFALLNCSHPVFFLYSILISSLSLQSFSKGWASQDPGDEDGQSDEGSSQSIDDIGFINKGAVLVTDGTDQAVTLVIQLPGTERKKEKTQWAHLVWRDPWVSLKGQISRLLEQPCWLYA